VNASFVKITRVNEIILLKDMRILLLRNEIAALRKIIS